MLAGTASANVFDPENSFVSLRIAGLFGKPFGGDRGASGSAALTGTAGTENIAEKGMAAGAVDIWATAGFSNGPEFLTGTPFITDVFATIQNGTGTFTQGATRGLFQGNILCPGNCFGGVAPLQGRTVTQLLGTINAITPVAVVGNTGPATLTPANPRFTSSVVGALPGTIFAEGAQWITGTANITNIATNIIAIIDGPRIGQTGVAFTLQVTPFENSLPTIAGINGVTVINVGGTTSFTPNVGLTNAGAQQVTLISPVHIDASTLTSNPPTPGMGVQTLRYVPEPGTMLLLGSAVAGLLAIGRKRMKR